jgi:hypothetical protein
LSRTAGQELALDQLEEICAFSDGAILLEEIVEPDEDRPSLKVKLSVSTRHHERAEGGLPIRRREQVILSVRSNFPRDYPWVDVVHKRFAGYSHVQWSTHICLYRAPDVEWSPKDGMYGFVDRLNKWFGAAALGQLDPDDAPLHPPVIYGQGKYRVVVRENVPDTGAGMAWIGSAAFKPIHDTRFDLVSWQQNASDVGEANAAAAVILLNDAFPIEYPKTVKSLVEQLEAHGLELVDLFVILREHVQALPEDRPLFVVLGTPMRRRDPNGPLKQHLAIWNIDEEAVTALRAILAGGEDRDEAITAFVKWSFDASVTWCRVDEAREEVTLSRDTGTATAWAKDKRVLLLGCGALGSHIADILVRAGAASLKLVDKGIVSSGVLVRQQFSDQDIGRAKASACRARLQAISPNCSIEAEYDDLKYGVLSKFGRDYDLIVDATASRAVSEALEADLRNSPEAPPIVSTSVTAKAKYGRVVVRKSNLAGGPKSIVRSAQLGCYSNPARMELAKAFWPPPGEAELFQPEPGCSEPTFQASAADMAFHAAGLINTGLAELASNDTSRSTVAFLPSVSKLSASKMTRLQFGEPKRITERNHGHTVLVAPEATKTIEAEVARSARVYGPDVETGGLMFGEIDDNLGMLFLDQVTGPPPDSYHSPQLFVCGTDGNQERSELQKKRSGGASGFIGIWHTHPVSPPRPSDVDFGAMYSILEANERPPRHTVMLIIGHAASHPEWAFYVFRRGEIDLERRRVIIRVRPQDV